MTTDTLIRAYYAAFNARRLADAEALLTADAVLDMPPFTDRARGAEGYQHFVRTWLQAFPDAQLQLVSVEQRSETMCEVELVATGTQTGPLNLSTYGCVAPSHLPIALHVRELLEFQDGKISFAGLTVDLQHLVRQLTQIDSARLLGSLTQIVTLSEEFALATPDRQTDRDLLDRIGRALDAARHAIRPQFNR
jgi:hypothetical protein